VLSRGASQALCATDCPQLNTMAEVALCDCMNRGHRGHPDAAQCGSRRLSPLRCGGGDSFIGLCAQTASVNMTHVDGMSKFPAWAVSDASQYISFHRMRPINGSMHFRPDGRCHVLSAGIDRPMLQVRHYDTTASARVTRTCRQSLASRVHIPRLHHTPHAFSRS
jgi:hypothetical protein